MKQVSLIVLFLASICMVTAQTVRIVDNNFNAPTGPNIYTTLQAAEDDCVDGDIIYVQPSTTKYGSITIDVPNITLTGIGFDLTKDLAYGSAITNVVLTNNPGNTANASGVTITGLTIDVVYFGNKRSGTGDYVQSGVLIYNNNLVTGVYQWAGISPVVETSNFIIRDNLINSYLIADRSTSNMLIRNNLFQGAYINLSNGPHTVTITNNVFYGDIRTANAADNIIIEHNNFIGTNASSTKSFGSLVSDLVSNNIFYGRSPEGSTSTFFDNIFTSNISFGTFNNALPPAGGGGQNTGSPNFEGVDPNFVNVPLSNTWSADYDFTPQTVTIGSDGTPVGITGGAYPWGETNFKLDTAPIPTIEAFNTTTTINPGDDLPVQIRAKGN